jgi:hypothetical protein
MSHPDLCYLHIFSQKQILRVRHASHLYSEGAPSDSGLQHRLLWENLLLRAGKCQDSHLNMPWLIHSTCATHCHAITRYRTSTSDKVNKRKYMMLTDTFIGCVIHHQIYSAVIVRPAVQTKLLPSQPYKHSRNNLPHLFCCQCQSQATSHCYNLTLHWHLSACLQLSSGCQTQQRGAINTGSLMKLLQISPSRLGFLAF